MALGDLIAKVLPKAFAKVGTEVTFRSVSTGPMTLRTARSPRRTRTPSTKESLAT